MFFISCLYVLALIHALSPIEKIERAGDCVTVQCGLFIVEIARAMTATNTGDLIRRKEADLLASRRRNELPASLPIVVLVSGALGALPARSPHTIVDDAEPTDVIEGPDVVDCRWRSLDQCAGVSDIAELKGLLGVP